MENNVKEIREYQGISISELARKTGYSRQYMYLIESGESMPSVDVALKISKALSVPVDDLFYPQLKKEVIREQGKK